MPELDVDGVKINYIDEGSGPPVVFVHGFASSLHGNWRAPGIFDAIRDSGRRAIALDCRGHGRSGKPHDPAQYGGMRMADDVIALMDHLGIDKADLIGYSMGGYISATLLGNYPQRFNSVVLAGIGNAVLAGWPRERTQAIAAAMSGERVEGEQAEVAKGFRAFAQASGNDLEALAAMQRGGRSGIDSAKFASCELPVLVLVGDKDALVGSGERLAATFPRGEHVTVPGDHLSAVGAPELRQALLDWLARH
jgi:pimeloyl-ACP methyl ester carboxylesterase